MNDVAQRLDVCGQKPWSSHERCYDERLSEALMFQTKDAES